MSRSLFFIRVYLILIILAVSLIGTSAAAQGATVARIDPAASSAQVGGQVNLSVKLDNVANLTAFEIHLAFDPTILEVVQISNGGFIAADFTVQNVFDNAAGTIDYAVAQMNSAPAQGSGSLLNIVFRAKANGSAIIALRPTQAASTGMLLSDQNGIAIQSSWTNGTVNVGSAPVTISPTTPPATPPTVPPTVPPTIPPTTPPTSPTVPPTAPTTTPPTVSPTTPPTTSPTVPTTVPPTATTAPITQALVRIDPADINVNVNDTFNLFVKVDNATNLSILELHLSFDPNILEVKQLINGGFLAADIVAQNTYDNSAGTIDYTIAQNGRAPAQGGGTLLTIMFRAKNSGTVNVNKRATQSAPNGVILADLNRTSLPATWTGGKVTVATPPTPPNPPVINRIHVVRWGEWLYCIGRAYKVDPWTIAQQNGIWLPYVIFPGQQLSIPNTPWTNMSAGTACQPQFSVAPQPVPPAPTTPSPVVTVIVVTPVPSTPVPATPIPSYSCRVTYVVNRGDTLYSIGRMYGISYEEIARVNSIANPRLIYNGQRLCIP